MSVQARGLLRVYTNFVVYRTKTIDTIRKNFDFSRKSRFIAKMVSGDATERKQWRRGLPTHKVYGSSSLSPKRLEILNRLYLANITDALTTSSRCSELADLGLMISRTELSSCGQSVKVFWSSCSAEADQHVDKILNECRTEVCDNIVTKSVGGFIPRIIFSKDGEATAARDVEHILSLPSVVRDLQTELPKNKADEGEEDEDRFTVEISTNILGLRRDVVLKRVIASAKRLRKAERRQREEEDRSVEGIEVSEEIPDRLASIDVRQQKSAIAAFISKQKKAEKKSFRNAIEAASIRNEVLEAVSDELSVEHNIDEEDEEEIVCFSMDLEDDVNSNVEENETASVEESNSSYPGNNGDETALGDLAKPSLDRKLKS